MRSTKVRRTRPSWGLTKSVFNRKLVKIVGANEKEFRCLQDQNTMVFITEGSLYRVVLIAELHCRKKGIEIYQEVDNEFKISIIFSLFRM